MTMLYPKKPSFIDRANGAIVIVKGTVSGIEKKEIHTYADSSRVETILRVAVDKVIKGKVKGKSIKVRVIGGKIGIVETPYTLKLHEGSSMILMLSPDIGPKRQKSGYVPYFSTAFKIDSHNRIFLKPSHLKELCEYNVEETNGKVPINIVTSIIKKVLKKS